MEISLHLWIVLAGSLASVSCALLGVFLVLRNAALLGDAISHSVLPGIAIAFLVSGSRDALPMFIGAALCAMLTASIAQFLSTNCKVNSGASLGVVFTTMFALGVVILRIAADHVDLDPGCVLYGLLEFTPFRTSSFLGFEIPTSVLILSVTLILNLLLVLLCYKELVLSSFDPELAQAMGIGTIFINYLLLAAVAGTSVAAFESVGSILVVTLFIAPAASARLLVDSVPKTLLLAVLYAALAAIVGYILAYQTNTSVAGMIATVSGGFFGITALLAPQYGIFSRFLRLFHEKLRVYAEDYLGLLYRIEEQSQDGLSYNHLLSALDGSIFSRLSISLLQWQGALQNADGNYRLTQQGREEARSLVRSHRLWETYLTDKLGLLPDHVHPTAETLEHFTNAKLEEKLATELSSPTLDPHGKIIPEK